VVTTVGGSGIYYDPFDITIDKDPHPVWKRMRDEEPLYHNDKFGFFALSRFDDVEKGLVDWETYRSGKGSTLEIILAGFDVPPGMILMEDPPRHDVHRALMSRVFTPRKMNAIEPKVREFCNRTLDPLVGAGRFDFVADLGAVMPMRTIGYLLGIPEQDQEAIRDRLDEGLRITDDGELPDNEYIKSGGELFADYIEWRAEHPSDDLMTELLVAEFTDETGTVRRLTREELLTYVGLIAGADHDQAGRVDGQAAGRAPRPTPGAGRKPVAHPRRDRGDPPLRGPLTGPGPHRGAGRPVLRADRARELHHAAAQRLGQPRRAALPRR